MAENLRTADTGEPMTPEQKSAFIKECRREEEACLYTSTMLFIRLRSVRFWRSTFIAAPIILGGIGSWGVLKGLKDPVLMWIPAICSLLAGMFPAIFKALELDGHIASISKQAAEFKNLQDRFRQAANFVDAKSDTDAYSQFDSLMDELDRTRASSVTPPERFFKAAQRKIHSGDYDFTVDAS